MLLIAAAGCGSEKAVEGNGPLPDNTEITALTVTPPSGTGKFELMVAYRFEYRGPGSVPRDETIYCYYYEPDGDYVHIGDIDPNQHPEAWALATREQWVDYEVTLPFDVRSASGTAPLGVYRMECEVGDRAALQEDTRGFTVVAAESGTTESIAAATTTFAPTTTTAPAPVYRLQVEMTVQGTGYEPIGSVDGQPDARARSTELARAALGCSDGRIRERVAAWVPVGDPMEAAIHALVGRLAGSEVIGEEMEPRRRRFAFDATRRRASAIVGDVLVVKGA